MAGPQTALSSYSLSLAGGVSGHFFGIFCQTMPSHVFISTGITPSPIGEDYTRVSSLHGNISSHALPLVCSMHHSDICPLLPEDFGDNRDNWKMCLIGYSIGRTPGYTIQGKYTTNVWKCNTTLHMHDSGWLIF